MTNIDNRTRKNRIYTREEVINILNKYRKYLNKETLDYLESLINLEVSVFENEDFMNELYCLDDIYEIAKYNICYRIDKQLKELPNMNKSLVVTIQNDNISVGYNFLKQCENYSFRLLDASFTRISEFTREPKQPMIKIFSTRNNIDIEMEDCMKMISTIEAKDYDAIALALQNEQKGIFKKKPVDISHMIEEDKRDLEKLRKNLANISKFSDRKIYVTNTVSDLLADEFGMEKDNEKPIVKKLPWIEIRKAPKKY